MNHRLLVPEQIVPEMGILLESLTDSGHIPVAEDSQAALEEPMLLVDRLSLA